MAIDPQASPEYSPDGKKQAHNARLDRSAGGVAYQRVGSGPGNWEFEIALIATHNGSRWQLPKGSVEPGETSLQAAIREVEEESGLQTVDEGFLRTIDYWYWDTYRKEVPELVHKQVDFFLLRMVGGELSDDSYEVDSVGWFTPEQATQMLTFAGEKAVVELAIERLHAVNP